MLKGISWSESRLEIANFANPMYCTMQSLHQSVPIVSCKIAHSQRGKESLWEPAFTPRPSIQYYINVSFSHVFSSKDEDPGLSYLLDDNSIFTLDLVGTNGVYLSYSGLSNTPLDAETQASYNVSVSKWSNLVVENSGPDRL